MSVKQNNIESYPVQVGPKDTVSRYQQLKGMNLEVLGERLRRARIEAAICGAAVIRQSHGDLGRADHVQSRSERQRSRGWIDGRLSRKHILLVSRHLKVELLSRLNRKAGG